MRLRASFACLLLLLAPAANAATPDQATLAQVDKIFADWRLSAHAPGLVYGVVADGRLVRVNGLGVQDVATRRSVSSDSLFRIASMSKAFTALAILKLRDEGKLSLDAPAETYVPEMKGWRYPTADSPRITVRNLLTHSAGLVEDNPWGDRQQALPEAGFTAMLKAGVPFSRSPGLAMEYSNFGYATLGRIVGNVSGMPYQDYIRRQIMSPLGMSSSGFDVVASPQARRALGYRWQDNRWVREPDMADGTFGAMGGMKPTPTIMPNGSPSCCRHGPRGTTPKTGRSGVRRCAKSSPAPTSRKARTGAPPSAARRAAGPRHTAWAGKSSTIATLGEWSPTPAATPATARSSYSCPTRMSASSLFPAGPTALRRSRLSVRP